MDKSIPAVRKLEGLVGKWKVFKNTLTAFPSLNGCPDECLNGFDLVPGFPYVPENTPVELILLGFTKPNGFRPNDVYGVRFPKASEFYRLMPNGVYFDLERDNAKSLSALSTSFKPLLSKARKLLYHS